MAASEQALSERFPAKPMEGLAYIVRLAKILNADNCAVAEVEGHPVVAPYGGISRAPTMWRNANHA